MSDKEGKRSEDAPANLSTQSPASGVVDANESLPSSPVSELSSLLSLESSQATTPLDLGVPAPLPEKLPVAQLHQPSLPTNFERLDFSVAPKSSIPSDIPSRQYASECITAAESSRLNPYALHPEEYHLLRYHISHSQVTTYLNIRNSILRLWLKEPWKALTRKTAVACAGARWFDAASVCFDWVVRRGYINYGCVTFSEDTRSHSAVPSIIRKKRVVVVVGAGISGLACARQLEGLFKQYADKFRMMGEDPPQVKVLEGRSRVGGRVYSREFKTTSSHPDPKFKGKRHTAEMGGMIITGFDRGNPMNVLVRGQLGLPYHALTPETTIYDSNGRPVDYERDQLVERLYNDCLDRVSEFKFKSKPQKLIEGNHALVNEARDAHGDGTKTIIEAEEAAAALPHAQPISEQSVPERVDRVPVSSDKLTGRVHTEPGVPATLKASEKAQMMGWEVNPAAMGRDNIDLGGAASAPTATLGSVLDHAITQYKNLVDLTALDHRLINWHIANLEYSNATNLHNLSIGLWDIDAGNEWEGSHTMVVGGYQGVARGLVHCPTALNVQTKTAVENIVYHNESTAGSASIACEDGSVVNADAVVCTVPLGVLKKASIGFQPALPQWKADAIHRLGFGILNKVVLVYEKAFWDSDRHIFGVLRDAPLRHSTSQSDYGRNRGRLFQWFNVSNTTGLPCLIALMAGDAGFDTEHTSNDVLVAEATDILRNVFGKDVPQPVEAVVTRWGSDRFARGSYSSAAPEMQSDDYDVMARPIGNLFFAGEHTIGTHPATVHGAYLSGLRAASEVLETMLGPIEVPTPLVLPRDSLLLSKRKASAQDPRQARLDAYEWEAWNHIVSQIGERPIRPAKVAANAYLLFSKAYFEEARKRCEESRKGGKPRSAPNEVRVMTSQMWKEAPLDVRQPFEEEVREQKRTFAEAMEKYNETAGAWDRQAIAIRAAYEREHPSVAGPEELAFEARSAAKQRRGRLVSYAEDRDGEKDAL